MEVGTQKNSEDLSKTLEKLEEWKNIFSFIFQKFLEEWKKLGKKIQKTR